MIITKEDFNKYIRILKEEDDYVCKMNDMFKEHQKKIGYSIEPSQMEFNVLSSIIVEILHKMFEDDSDWIGYFCYDLDYGRNYKIDSVTEKDGTPILMSNADELYDFLISKMNKKHNKEE